MSAPAQQRLTEETSCQNCAKHTHWLLFFSSSAQVFTEKNFQYVFISCLSYAREQHHWAEWNFFYCPWERKGQKLQQEDVRSWWWWVLIRPAAFRLHSVQLKPQTEGRRSEGLFDVHSSCCVCIRLTLILLYSVSSGGKIEQEELNTEGKKEQMINKNNNNNNK